MQFGNVFHLNERQRSAGILAAFCISHGWIIYTYLSSAHPSVLGVALGNLCNLGFYFLFPMWQSPNRLSWFSLLYQRRKHIHWLWNNDAEAYMVVMNQHNIPLLFSFKRDSRAIWLLDYNANKSYEVLTGMCVLSCWLYMRLPFNRILHRHWQEEGAKQAADQRKAAEFLEGHLLSVSRLRKLKLLIE